MAASTLARQRDEQLLGRRVVVALGGHLAGADEVDGQRADLDDELGELEPRLALVGGGGEAGRGGRRGARGRGAARRAAWRRRSDPRSGASASLASSQTAERTSRTARGSSGGGDTAERAA